MKTVLHKANTRGTAEFGWLHSKHTFSFGHYYNPERVHFGALRVLNDDIVEAGMGFGTHPHDNMEIISIPLQGALEHKDSTGKVEAIKTGEVQIMSAGTGLTHSEYNHSKTDRVNFLQIWVIPKVRNIEPRYDQKEFDTAERENKIQTIVAPNDDRALWINQDSWFSLSDLDAGKQLSYKVHKSGNGVYTFVIDGSAEINGHSIGQRDGLGVSEVDELTIKTSEGSSLLLMEVPMGV